MSYVRFGEADVYVYADVAGYLCCCGCSLNKDWQHYSTDAIIAHLREHQQAGDHVPEYVFEDLLADKEENDRWIAETLVGKNHERGPSSRFKREVSAALELSDLSPQERMALEEIKGSFDDKKKPAEVEQG